MQKQVDKAHYNFATYIDKGRWASMWHQLDEVMKLNPDCVLEVGPGPGLFKAAASVMGTHCETLDIDPELKPDHVASVYKMPFEDETFDIVCAFQMLEHLPFEKTIEAFREMVRVAKLGVVISLPDAAVRWPFSIYIPRIGALKFSVPKPRLFAPVHQFDGQHYWEINKANYSLDTVVAALLNTGSVRLVRSFRVHEKMYHRFLIFEKSRT